MAGKPPIPSSPEDITAPWLTQALRSGGAIDGSVHVTRVTKRALGTRAGQSGWYSDLGVEYSSDSPQLPRQLFVKGPIIGSELLADALLDMFRHELIFYTSIGPRTRISIPNFYYGDLTTDPDAAVIVMESLASDSIGTIEKGLGSDDAKLVLDELAQLHGRWWNSTQIDDIPWAFGYPEIMTAFFLPHGYEHAWKRAKAEAPELLNTYTRELGNRLVERQDDIWAHLASVPRTVIQLDSRVDNVAFRERSTSRSAVLFDWTCTHGPAVWDLALLLLSGLEGRDLDLLPTLLQHYCHRLAEAQVDDYPAARATEDLGVAALGAFMAYHITLGAALDLGRSHPGTAGRRRLYGRIARAVESMNGQEVLRAL